MIFITLLLSLAVLLPNLVVSAAPSLLHSSSRRGSPAQINTFLYSHNKVRAAHNAAALTWSKEFAALAETWADNCEFKRTNGILRDTQYGEHHAAATGEFPIVDAIGLLTEDEAQYNPSSPTYNHFTQVVWKSTTEVGCARATCDKIFDHQKGPATYYVCFYNPAGNIIGEASENVQI
ncbi:PR-1-like protein [Collybia nuda]|uniref:PR-1-like protein n=1 Tax=Collybia nuda TaxID=64659 RepID=A0A9P5Y796_9AGAR|nr:PR-1-like protein [Collybia nuda]